MKAFFINFILLVGFSMAIAQGQNLEFTAGNTKSFYPKFVINNGKTTLTTKAMITMTQTWNQVPVNFDNSDGRSRYKMVITEDSKDLRTTYEFFWMHMRSVNRYSGNLKVKILDKKSDRVTERSESYSGKLI
ncbi:hypothetical protein [Mongoliitalea lutea]|uniref:Uncharacterized protein n=1 Tax=Mongoliitalea lutea TaxID=849756 RepID=A0A8J3CVT0_9BACT|nr:hypothetical protein [Mongoliitalea lutea]GHB26239.1 hypothetical protein GCM10008106_03520 [Mongoliitalea lutea]